jgi:dUTP pyrophosphatase
MRPVTPRIQIKKLRSDAILPRYMTEDAAGMDLCAALDAPVTIAPGKRAAIATGIAVAIPRGYEGQLRPRSGLAREHGVTLANSPATIDADYRGPLVVVLSNLGDAPVTIEARQRIAQMVIAPVLQAQIEEVEELSATARGEGGFGSTGQ